jgi:hypothetical protein
MMGIEEVISTNPVKLCRPNKGPRLADPCDNGPRVMTLLPSEIPAVLITVNVIVADCVEDGFA